MTWIERIPCPIAPTEKQIIQIINTLLPEKESWLQSPLEKSCQMLFKIINNFLQLPYREFL